MLFAARKMEKIRQDYIGHCTAVDAPRLAADVFPGDVTTDENLAYFKDQNPSHTCDVHFPFNVTNSAEAFLVIHGGAFVYGNKELDKCFAMHLAHTAQVPVVNMNYTLLPEGNLTNILNEIIVCMNFISARYGFKRFHLVGDSAGAYLALATSLIVNSRHISHAMWIFEKCKVTVESAGLICGAYTLDKNSFPGCFFENSKEGASRLPDYAYDLTSVAARCPSLRIALVTGESDFLREDNIHLKKLLEADGRTVPFYDAANTDDRKMEHVFPIAHPDWPEGSKAIDLLVDNALSRR